jgi:trimeric autotransporter adhesin
MHLFKQLVQTILFLVPFHVYSQELKIFQNFEKSPFDSDVFINRGTTKLGDYIYFRARTQNNGFELWKTKGDSENTQIVTDIPAGSSSEFTYTTVNVFTESIGDTIVTITNNTRNLRLIKQNGTNEIINFYTQVDPIKFKNGLLLSGYFPNTNPAFYYYKNSQFNYINEIQYPSNSIVLDSILYFTGQIYLNSNPYTPSSNGIWKSNATATGTNLVVSIPSSTNLGEFTNIDNKYIIFTKSINNNCSIWKLNLLDNSTELLFTLGNTGTNNPFIGMKYYTDGTGTFFFSHNNNVYKSDGTPTGTIKINPTNVYVRQAFGFGNGKLLILGWLNNVFGIISYENSNFQMFKLLTGSNQDFTNSAKLTNGNLVFARENALGQQIWVSDWTPNGTLMLKDINPNLMISSRFSPIKSYGNFCLFGAKDPEAGFELFRTDGTPNGTFLVKDIGTGDNGLDWNGYYSKDIFADSIYLSTNNKFYSSHVSNPDFKSIDKPNIRFFVHGVVEDKMFFSSSSPSVNPGIFKDYVKNINGEIKQLKGTFGIANFRKKIIENSTDIIYETSVGLLNYHKLQDSISTLTSIPASNSIVFKNYIFYVYNDFNYLSLIRFNINTKQISTIHSDVLSMSGLTILNDTLFFYSGTSLRRFYKTGDGINFNSVNNDINVWNKSVKFDSSVIFGGDLRPEYYSTPYAKGLFKYNAVQGLKLIKTLTACWIFFVFNNVLYFLGSDEVRGEELWRTDGSTAGTYLVKDINVGFGNSSPNNFFELNGKLYFVADDGVHGKEIWVTDGTASGTKLVSSITSDISDPNFSDFKVYDRKVYFFATDCKSGIETWVFNPDFCETLSDGNWSDLSIWKCGRVPSVLDNVKVNAPHRVLIEPNTDINIKSMTVETGAVIEIPPRLISKP